MPCILVHYGELALKDQNRAHFEKMLVENLRAALKGAGIGEGARIERPYGRILVEVGAAPGQETAVTAAACERLRKVPGLVYLAPAVRLDRTLEAVEAHLGGWLPGKAFASFAIETKRADKRFALPSPDVNRRVGAFVQGKTGWKVDLGSPALTIRLEILDDEILLYTDRVEGPGGLPAGMSGRAAILLSGGIDSPVAAWMMARRGCRLIAVHCHSAPYTGASSQDKVRALIAALTPWTGPIPLHLVPLGDAQKRIVADCPEALRVLLYRRFMFRAALAVARDAGAQALVTGESLGQVASQTLENMAAAAAVSDLPVLRPLIGMDKEEIVRKAKDLGTYAISIEPHDDCCSFLVPRHPATKSTAAELAEAERVLEVDALLSDMMGRVVRE